MDVRHKIKKYGIVIGRVIALYFVFAVVSFVSWLFLQNPAFEKDIRGFWNAPLYAQVAFGYGVIIFFSLSSVFQLHNPELKNRFYEKGIATSSFLRNCAVILRSHLFWIEIFVLSASLLLFSSLPPLAFFRKGFLGGVPKSHQTWMIFGSIGLFGFLYFLASLSTLNWWGRNEKKRSDERPPLQGLLIQLSYTVVLWMLGGALLTILYPLFSGFFKLFYIYWVAILGIVLLLLLAVLMIQYVIVMAHRGSLIRRIRHVCREDGHQLKVEGHPYLGVWFSGIGSRIRIQTDTALYVCSFIGGMQRKNPLDLREDGMAEYSKFRIWWSHIVLESYAFDVEEASQKILLACPCRGLIFAKDGNERRQLEFGDRIWDYKVYDGVGFLNALKRKCI